MLQRGPPSHGTGNQTSSAACRQGEDQQGLFASQLQSLSRWLLDVALNSRRDALSHSMHGGSAVQGSRMGACFPAGRRHNPFSMQSTHLPRLLHGCGLVHRLCSNDPMWLSRYAVYGQLSSSCAAQVLFGFPGNSRWVRSLSKAGSANPTCSAVGFACLASAAAMPAASSTLYAQALIVVTVVELLLALSES